jgi:hypothetical protein
MTKDTTYFHWTNSIGHRFRVDMAGTVQTYTKGKWIHNWTINIFTDEVQNGWKKWRKLKLYNKKTHGL